MTLFCMLQLFPEVAQNTLRIRWVFQVYRIPRVFQVCGHPAPCYTTYRASLDAVQSLRLWEQAVQILTGWSQPRDGTGLSWGEHGPQTPLPHARQWCSFNRGPNKLPQTLHALMPSSASQYVGRAASRRATTNIVRVVVVVVVVVVVTVVEVVVVVAVVVVVVAVVTVVVAAAAAAAAPPPPAPTLLQQQQQQ